jgi:Fe-S-cluster containining protein
LTEDEVAELVRKIKQEYGLEIPLKKYFRQAMGEHGLYYAIKMIKGQCIFLNKEKRCRIYTCRPTLCELYPVINVESVDEQCPKVSKGEFRGALLAILKKRYEDEINESIKCEQTFRFI